MIFLLDTNVISEFGKPRPDANVLRWVSEIDEVRVFLSVVSIAEIRRGIELLPDGSRRDRLVNWLASDVSQRFEGRVLPVDERIAEAWGVMMARSQRIGVSLSTLDAFLAATSSVHEAILVTRNVCHFEQLGISVINPWLHSG